MIREFIRAYIKLLLSKSEDIEEKIEFLNFLLKHTLNKNSIEEAISEYNRKYIDLDIYADIKKEDVIISYSIFEKNEIAEILKRDLISYISDLLINDAHIKDFAQLLINLSKKKPKNINENITLDDFLKIFKGENNLIFNVFGESGTGKTITTYYIAHLLNNGKLENVYFTTFKEFYEYVKTNIDNGLDLNAVVFDELKEFPKEYIKVLNRIRYFNKDQKPITFFIISHEKNEYEKIKKQIDYYIYFKEKCKFRIYKRYYEIKTKMRVLFPTLYKPKIKNYILNSVKLRLSEKMIRYLKFFIEKKEKDAKTEVIKQIEIEI